MTRFGLFAVGVVLTLVAAVSTLAQGPPAPPPSCDEQLNNEMLNRGGAIQQLGVATQNLAIVRSQLAAMTKERDEAKAALAKLTPKPAATPEPPKAPK